MSAKRVTLTEHIQSPPARVDLTEGVIYGAKILGRISKNGREYSDKALHDGLRLYEGSVINIDHPDAKEGNKPRGFMEGLAVINKTYMKEGEPYGDLHFIKAHPDTASILEWASRFPDKFGLSHNADGNEVSKGGKRIVESLDRVISVDVVRNPATVKGLFESEQAMKKTLRQIIEAEFPKTHKGAGLLEMDGMADLPVEAPAAGDSEDQIWAAFKQAIMSAVDDDKLDIKATLKKIGEILKAYDKLTGSEAEKSDTAPPGAEPKTESEKLKAMLGTLLEQQLSPITKKLAAIEQEGAIRKLCEQFQVTPDAGLLEALTKLPDEAAQKSLLEREAKNRPRFGGRPKPLVESIGAGEGAITSTKDVKAFAASLR
jgi:hypothetical protein